MHESAQLAMLTLLMIISQVAPKGGPQGTKRSATVHRHLINDCVAMSVVSIPVYCIWSIHLSLLFRTI